MASQKYIMTISRLTADKLGVKLYDRISAVLAEIVANSYDADATAVTITSPMDEFMATKVKGEIRDRQYEIRIVDNGHGMTPAEVNHFYMRVGAERRNDAQRGDKSKRFRRRVMGRKGVGKLAPFGVCRYVEIISSGGQEVVDRKDHGSKAKGYNVKELLSPVSAWQALLHTAV